MNNTFPQAGENWLHRRAQDCPERVAVTDATRTWSYGELYERAARLAGVLSRYCIEPGDRVATVLDNSLEHVLLIHALMLMNAVFVPLNIRLTPLEIRKQCGIIQPKLMIIRDDLDFKLFSKSAAPAPCISLFRVLTDLQAVPIRLQNGGTFKPAEHSTDSPLSILFSSGTSGKPKAIPLTYGNHHANAIGSAQNLGVEESDNWLCIIPLCHAGGLAIVLRSVIYGTACTMINGFDAQQTIRAISDNRVTIVSLVPTMLHRVLEAEESFDRRNLPRLRAILLGGAAAAPSLLAEAYKREIPVFSTYGLTEGSSQITTMMPGAAESKRGSAGKPIGGAVVSIRSDKGKPVSANTIGEIWITGPMVTSGYIGNAKLKQKHFSKGWFRTGDLGMLDEDGYLRVECRREDLIVSGGENISPREIEQVLLSCPGVNEAAILGLPDSEWGQIAAAALVMKDASVNITVVEAFCRERLAGFKIPKVWKVVDELPRTASGKVMREMLGKIMKDEV